MKTNNIDQNIKKKFDNRTLEPSASAWERLSVQLDEQPKQKKIGWFFYIGAVASILLLFTIGYQFLSSDSNNITPVQEVVKAPIDKTIIDAKIEEFINEIPVEEALVKEEVKKNTNSTSIDKTIETSQKIKSITKTKVKKSTENKGLAVSDKNQITNQKNKKVNVDDKVSPILKETINPKIKVNAEDLLYAVTHTSQEVKRYYAKYSMNRDDLLNTIKLELKKSNLKVNPNSILAEVERT
ncbi:MAG: hypothetical protein ABF286_03120, partial [Polaribacter sp.]